MPAFKERLIGGFIPKGLHPIVVRGARDVAPFAGLGFMQRSDGVSSGFGAHIFTAGLTKIAGEGKSFNMKELEFVLFDSLFMKEIGE